MDNATFHKSHRTRELIEAKGCTLLYLPPYNPDFNPTKKKWGYIKNMIKKIRDQFRDFNKFLNCALRYN